MTEDINNCYTTKIDEFEEPVQQICDAAELNEFEKTIWEYKALCYENICFWIVQNSKWEKRDLLAMKVHLQHHKEVNNKPKLYIASSLHSEPELTHNSSTTFLFQENLFLILCLISHILTYTICDDTILINDYTFAELFFVTNLQNQSIRVMKVHWKSKWLK